MLSNVQQIRLYELSIAIVVIVLGIAFNISARQRLHDVRLLNEVRTFAFALERYRQDFLKYPLAGEKDVRAFSVLSDNNFVEGIKTYYRSTITSRRPVLYHSDQNSYSIRFTLQRTWPEQGIYTRRCSMTEFAKLNCGQKK